jgi:hypothetical protein
VILGEGGVEKAHRGFEHEAKAMLLLSESFLQYPWFVVSHGTVKIERDFYPFMYEKFISFHISARALN